MSARIRRSWLVVPMSKPEEIARAARSAADVIVLDLVEFVAEEDKPGARDRVEAAIRTAQASGAEVFAQVDPELLVADLHACAMPGLTGVIVSQVESAQQIADVDGLLAELEAKRGILPGTLEIVAGLETARGNQAAYDIGRASPRIWGLTLGRADLIMDLRPEPSGEIHMMPYLMQRLITVARALGAMAIGAWWRAPARGLLAGPDDTYQAARRGRAIGFTGSPCIDVRQVEALNRGFTPDAAEAVAAQELMTAYRAAVAQGVAVVEQGDSLVDRGSVTQARGLLDRAAACAARDREKAEMAARPPLARP
jgi:citrate lyase subunit beta / citryl-CoA lyase